MKTRTIILIAVAIVIVIGGILVARDFIVPSLAPAQTTAMPTSNNPFAATPATYRPGSRVNNIAYVPELASIKVAQTEPYKSCAEDRQVTPTPTGAPANAATVEATLAATSAATAEATVAASDNTVVVRIVAAESEACYQVGEVFLGQNQFALAVGITKTIDGFIKVDLGNVAATEAGEINIDISKFESDSPRRDGIIRQRWLESNTYPTATLSNITFGGLPTGAYTDGELLSFTMSGDLKLRTETVPTTFTMTATFSDNTLIASGYTDVKMSDWGFSAPEVGGFVRANDDFRIVLNIVARPE